MKKQLNSILLCLATAIPFASLSQIPVIETVRTTGTNCDGMAILTNIADFPISDYEWEWRYGSTVLQTGGDSTFNYCIGDYELAMHDLVNGGITSMYFRIGTDCAVFTPQITSATIVNAVPGNDIGYIDPLTYGGIGGYTWSWSNGSSSMIQSGLSAGTYTLVVTDYYGCTDTATYEIIVDSNGVYPLDANFYIMFQDYESDFTMAMVNPRGGIPPYQTVFSNASVISGDGGTAYDALNWAGLQYATCYDSNGDSVVVNFIIAESTALYGDVPYPDSTSYHPVYCGLVTNCDIDYASLDTAYLSTVVFDSTAQQLYITWAVLTAADTTYFYDTLSFAGITGVYTFTISAYCPQKSIGDYLTVLGQLYFDSLSGSFLIVEESAFEDVIAAPNPFDQTITLYGIERTTKVMLFDAYGRSILFDKQQEDNYLRVTTYSQLPSGIYYLQIMNDNGIRIFQLMH